MITPKHSREAIRPKTISFGEILFDQIDDDYHLGGAPLNFAYYLHQFDIPVALVSAIGDDRLGNIVRNRLGDSGIESTWVVTRPEPTGTAKVTLVSGTPEFSITEGCAWEHIDVSNDLLKIEPSLLYVGTVAQKTAVNRFSLDVLCSLNPRHIFADINLRPNLYSPKLVLDTLQQATILKLNESEWNFVEAITSLHTPHELLDNFNLEIVAVTYGSNGAELYVPGRRFVTTGDAKSVVDPVGAGDAFAAALAAGIIQGANLEYTLNVACQTGAEVVQSRGSLVNISEDLRSAFN